MDFKSFSEQVADYFRKTGKPGTEVQIRKIPKNNGVILHGMTVREPGEACSGVIYLEPEYEEFINGDSFMTVVLRMEKTLHMSHVIKVSEVDFMKSYETAAPHIRFHLVNYDMNRNRLMEMPHRCICDLAVIYYCRMKGTDVEGRIYLTNELMQGWNVTEEDIYDLAIQNTALSSPAVAIMLEQARDRNTLDLCDIDDMDSPYVITNTDKNIGAGVMLYPGLMREIAEKMKSSFYIIPSSIHEIIVIPDNDDCDEDMVRSLGDIIRTVNSTALPEEEVLSDHSYYYDKNEDSIMEFHDCLEDCVI